MDQKYHNSSTDSLIHKSRLLKISKCKLGFDRESKMAASIGSKAERESMEARGRERRRDRMNGEREERMREWRKGRRKAAFIHGMGRWRRKSLGRERKGEGRETEREKRRERERRRGERQVNGAAQVLWHSTVLSRGYFCLLSFFFTSILYFLVQFFLPILLALSWLHLFFLSLFVHFCSLLTLL